MDYRVICHTVAVLNLLGLPVVDDLAGDIHGCCSDRCRSRIVNWSRFFSPNSCLQNTKVG